MNNRPVVFITGASRGIGVATCRVFALSGYDFALLSNEPEKLESIAEDVRLCGATCAVWPGDLADLDFVQHAVDETYQRFGRIDVLVNNAAWRDLVTMRKIELASWEQTIRVCLTAPAFLARWCAEYMETAGRGVILNISSIQSRFPSGISPAYVAAKGGIDALTYELANLYGPSGIRVLSVNPGAIDTDLSRTSTPGDFDQRMRDHVSGMVPLGRFGRPEEVARVLLMLASDAASYLTGTCIDVDGGWSHQCSPYALKQIQFPGEFSGEKRGPEA